MLKSMYFIAKHNSEWLFLLNVFFQISLGSRRNGMGDAFLLSKLTKNFELHQALVANVVAVHTNCRYM